MPSDRECPSVLFVVSTSDFGGAQEYAYQVMRRIRESCHVTLAIGTPGTFEDLITSAAHEVVRLDSFDRSPFGGLPGGISKIRRLAAAADAVHASTVKASFATALAVPAGRRFIWTAHGFNSTEAVTRGGLRHAMRAARRRIGRRADHIVVASEDVKRKVVASGISKQKIEVIYCGVDFERFNRSHRKTVRPGRVVAAGRFVPVKGFEDYVRAAAILHGHGWTFELYGEGPQGEFLRELNRELDANVTFKPFAHDLPQQLGDAQLFVIPSRMDGFPLLAGEVMALGVPLVITDGGGVVEVLSEPGVDGFIAHAGDPKSLAATIMSALTDPELESVGRAGSATTRERYDWDDVARRYLDLLLPREA